jgi:hypothetical protein
MMPSPTALAAAAGTHGGAQMVAAQTTACQLRAAGWINANSQEMAADRAAPPTRGRSRPPEAEEAGGGLTSTINALKAFYLYVMS